MTLHHGILDTAYHPDFGTQVNYTFEPMSDDPDAQVDQTIDRLIANLNADVGHPAIQEMAARALDAGSGDPIAGVWAEVKPHIAFRQDFDIAQDLQTPDQRKSTVVETIIRPVDQALLILTKGKGVEDCDGFTGYAACLLYALGVPVSFVTVNADSDVPRQFSHIYIAAYPPGGRIALDFSHGPYPGWECPNMGRVKEWPVETSLIKAAWWPLITIGMAWWALRYLQNKPSYLEGVYL